MLFTNFKVKYPNFKNFKIIEEHDALRAKKISICFGYKIL